jgi:hypothetical protein
MIPMMAICMNEMVAGIVSANNPMLNAGLMGRRSVDCWSIFRQRSIQKLSQRSSCEYLEMWDPWKSHFEKWL